MNTINSLKALEKQVVQFFFTQDIEAETLIDDGDLFVWVEEVDEDAKKFIESLPFEFKCTIGVSLQKEGMKFILFTQI